MYPERIGCLSGESADICHRLGAADRVVAVSAFAPSSMLAGRTIVEAVDVCAADPQIIFVSWCSKRVDLRKIAGRPGWQAISAVRHKNIYSVDSAEILQPGPGILTGVRQMAGIIEAMAAIVRCLY